MQHPDGSDTLTLNDLVVGQSARVTGFLDEQVSIRLMEMGVVPGEEIVMDRVAPFGDPVAVRVSDLVLMMRRQEARTVRVAIGDAVI